MIKANEREINNLREIYTVPRSPVYSHENHTPNTSKKGANFEGIVEKICLLESQITRETEKLLDLKLLIMKSIEVMKNNDEKLVLRLKYLEFRTFEEIAEDMSYSVMQIHRIHKNALIHFKIYENASK